jgi:hypothetical protein
MLEINSVGVITCYAIIIAMAILVFKAIQHPLTGIINAFNPFLRNRQFSNFYERISDLEMNKMCMEDDIRTLKKEIEKLKSLSKKSAKK